jgi:hypothetical protein
LAEALLKIVEGVLLGQKFSVIGSDLLEEIEPGAIFSQSWPFALFRRLHKGQERLDGVRRGQQHWCYNGKSLVPSKQG